MCKYLLENPLVNVSAEAKFLLLKFIQLFGMDEVVQKGVKELASDIGLSDRLVSRSLEELLARGHLVRQTLCEGRGRPKSEYSISTALFAKLHRESSASASAHEELLNSIITSPELGGRQDLSSTNRLLLAVLLQHADKFGVVRDLGLSELSKLTGLNRERAKGHIHKLQSLRILRFWEAGLTGSTLFGAMKSVYFLNLNCSVLSVSRDSTAAFVFFCGFDPSGFSDLDEAGLIGKATWRRRDGQFDWQFQRFAEMPDAAKYASLATYFVQIDGRSPRGFQSQRLLQLKLDEYASFLLSRYWRVLATEMSLMDSELINVIGKDLRISSPPTEDGALAPLAVFLYEVSLCIARRYQCLFAGLRDFSFESLDLMILPAPKDRWGKYRGSRILLAVAKRESVFSGCYVVTPDALNTNAAEHFEREDEIADADRYQYGLLREMHCPKRYGVFLDK